MNKGRRGEGHYKNDHSSPFFPASMPLHKVTVQYHP